jgi:hypothetical protein
VAADLRQGEHIPKMQNNIGRKSMLRVLRQPRSKGGGVLGAVPYRRIVRRSARHWALQSCLRFKLDRILRQRQKHDEWFEPTSFKTTI